MTEFFHNLDTQLFIFLNATLANPVFDRVMPVITNSFYWRLPLAAILLYLLIWGKKKGRITVLLFVLTAVISDQISSHLIKSFIHRLRPCHVVPQVHLLVNCVHSYSFPSSHAVNSFAFAIMFWRRYPQSKYFFFPIVAIIAYSRVAVGVHYPFDILGGALIGIGVGLGLFWLYRKASRRWRWEGV